LDPLLLPFVKFKFIESLSELRHKLEKLLRRCPNSSGLAEVVAVLCDGTDVTVKSVLDKRPQFFAGHWFAVWEELL
jgi:hypothetical protein